MAAFDKWDEKYEEDERGALVAGIRECKDAELINMLMNIQKLAAGSVSYTHLTLQTILRV